MNRSVSVSYAIDLAKEMIQASQLTFVPNSDCANELADFIETLADRLEKIED